MPSLQEEKIARFSELASPLRSEPEFQRISLFVQNKTTMRLQPYLQGPASETEKNALLDELIQIIETKDWAKLPEAPNGQAENAASPSAPAAAPKAAGTATPPPAGGDDDIVEENAGEEEGDDPLMAALAKRLKEGAGLSEKEVRKIIKEMVPDLVRTELRSILRGVSDSLKKPE